MAYREIGRNTFMFSYFRKLIDDDNVKNRDIGIRVVLMVKKNEKGIGFTGQILDWN